jgi:ribosomal protein L37AE/L43A
MSDQQSIDDTEGLCPRCNRAVRDDDQREMEGDWQCDECAQQLVDELREKLAQSGAELDQAQKANAELRTTLEKERAAIARFLVPYRAHLPESWLDHFEQECGVYFDAIGFVNPRPIPPDCGNDYIHRHELKQMLAICEKFIAKVESGRARSTETYDAMMKERTRLRALLGEPLDKPRPA